MTRGLLHSAEFWIEALCRALCMVFTIERYHYAFCVEYEALIFAKSATLWLTSYEYLVVKVFRFTRRKSAQDGCDL